MNWKAQRQNCKGKKKLDKKGAITAKNYAWNHERLILDIYPCPICGCWHLTSKNNKRHD